MSSKSTWNECGRLFVCSLAFLNDILVELQAFDLERGSHQGSYMVEEIWQELAKSLYRLWQAEASIRERQQQELR